MRTFNRLYYLTAVLNKFDLAISRRIVLHDIVCVLQEHQYNIVCLRTRVQSIAVSLAIRISQSYIIIYRII